MGILMHRHPFGEAALCLLVSMGDTSIQICVPETHVTKDLWAHNPNLVNMCWFYGNNDNPIRSQFWMCHDCSAAVACAEIWPDLIVLLDIKATWIFTKFGLLVVKVFVRWVPAPWPSQQVWHLRRWQAPLRDMIHVTGKQHRNWQQVTDGVRLITQLILGLCPANERRRYFVTTSLIGW